MNVIITSKFNKIQYNDTEDHFNNGVLRLLSLTETEFCNWIDISEQYYNKSLLEALSNGFHEFKNITRESKIWYDFIADNKNYGIIKENNIAWLARLEGNEYIREYNPPIYEEEYFEGNTSVSHGYGKYLLQADWRLEKSQRQIKDIVSITGLKSGNVLDIGSGYGYFRKALDDAGFNHYGIEISNFAAQVAKNIYNFETHVGTIDNYNNDIKFNIITLWDVIEHIPNTKEFLKKISDKLLPGGFLIIKTPNIYCPEANIFGPYYHSFKREHLVYFSNKGLIEVCSNIGLNHFKSNSKSHLLSGFFPEQQIKEWELSLNGSDLIIYFQK